MLKIIAAALFAVAAILAGFVTIAIVVVATLGVWLASRLLGGRFPVIFRRSKRPDTSSASRPAGDVIDVSATEISSTRALPSSDAPGGSAAKSAENTSP